MTDEELFHAQTLHLGGRFPRNRLPKASFDSSYGHILHLANGLIESARTHIPGLPKIHFDFILNGSFNAYAFKAEGRYFIGFNTGTQYLLQLVIFRMLSDARLFDFIGNASEENNDPAPLTGYSAHGEKMYQAGIYPDPPKNYDRFSYACDLIRRAVYFLVGHEIAHITRGHVDYLLSKSGSGFIPEVGWAAVDADGAMERQALEADADRRSTISAIHSAHETHVKSDHDKSHFMASRLSVDALLFDWAFAMNTIFRLFGDVRFNPDTAVASSYPPAPIRRLIATMTAHQFVTATWDSNMNNTALKALKRAALYSEIAFMRILGQEHGAHGLLAFGKDGVEYCGQIAKVWIDTVSHRVSPYAFERDGTETPSFVDHSHADSITHDLLTGEP